MNSRDGTSSARTSAAVPPTRRPATTRVLWVVLALMLAVTLVAEAFVHLHPRHRLESWFGFNAAFGFLGCIAMVLVAKALGAALQRAEDYYECSDSSSASRERAGD